MSVTDPIADMLTMMRNANSVGKTDVDVPYSCIKESVLKIFQQEGFIKTFKVLDSATKKMIRIYLVFSENGEPRITGIERVSKSSLRKYVGHTDIPSVIGGLGVAVMSTSQGVMSDRQARKAGIGGEVMCYVW